MMEIKAPSLLRLLLYIILLTPIALPAQEVNEEEQAALKALDTASGFSKVKVLNQLFIATYYSDPRKAFEYGKEAMSLARSIGDKKGLANSHNNLGLFFLDRGSYPNALEQFIWSRDLRVEMQDTLGQADVYTNMGVLYQTQGLYPQALESYHTALRYDRLSGDSINIGYCLNNIGNAWYFFGKKDSALYYLNLALIYKQSDQASLPSTLNTLGEVYLESGDIAKAEYYFQEALNIRNRHEHIMGQAESYLSLASLEMKRGKHPTAITYASKAYNLSVTTGNTEQMQEAALKLSTLYAKSNQYKQAFEWQTMYLQLKDSIFNAEIMSRMIGMEASHTIEQQETEIQLLTSQRELSAASARESRILLVASILGLILTLIILRVLYSRYQTRKKAHKILAARSAVIEEKNKVIARQNQLITDSIRYARNIQDSFLPPVFIPGHVGLKIFMIHKPKDIVSGDFYWMEMSGNRFVCLIADGTGHGVPGAFMSLIGIHLMKNCLRENPDADPGTLLALLHIKVLASLRPGEKDSGIQEGMDAAIISWHPEQKILKYAGAARPLVWVSKTGLQLLKGEKFTIGERRIQEPVIQTHSISLEDGDRFYVFSDGMTDWLGGAKKRRITTPIFLQWLEAASALPFDERKHAIEQNLLGWQKNTAQADDALLAGFEVFT
jgi:serine phosphatase RsbU (regulator of sigma subunit)/Tfp pilus assembly protein PilF